MGTEPGFRRCDAPHSARLKRSRGLGQPERGVAEVGVACADASLVGGARRRHAADGRGLPGPLAGRPLAPVLPAFRGDQLVCTALTWDRARHRRMAASRKAPRVR